MTITSLTSSALRQAPLVVATLVALAITPLETNANEKEARFGSGIPATDNLVVADAHAYRHCHNLPRRTYCHKADRLPQNWPPNSNTPHSAAPQERPGCPKGASDCTTEPTRRQG